MTCDSGHEPISGMGSNEPERWVTVRVERANSALGEAPHLQEYRVGVTQGTTILDVLQEIKAEQDDSLTFRCSCGQGVCGSCGVNVNGVNVLACETSAEKHVDVGETITIRPLSGLEVVRDLVVDLDRFWEQYRRSEPWLVPKKHLPERESLVFPEQVSQSKSAERCVVCGICYSACPVVQVGERFRGPHAMLKTFLRMSDPRDQAVDERLARFDSVWSCTTCFLCDSLCPKGLEPGSTCPDLRSWFTEDSERARMLPQDVGLALKNVLQRHNPFGLAHADRLNWASDTPIKDALEERADALLFACCLSCYDPRGQTAARAILRVMQSAGVEVGTLGSAESCCGSEVRRMGEIYLYDEMAEELTSFLEEARADQVVTISPHCLDAFTNHYPDIAKPTAHYTQYLADLLKGGRLGFGGRCDKRITYHDPCYLGIQNGIFEAPRMVLRSIPGVELVEMQHHHDNSWCCGGGGGRMWHEADSDTDDAPGDSASRMSHARVREALETGAEVIATACPFCLRMLDDAVSDLEMRNRIEVLDIAELVVSAL